MSEEYVLMYVYVDDIGRTFKNQEICFSNEFVISYKNETLTLEKKYNPYNDIWGNYINSINLLIGENGSGKTTILELLGSERKKKRSGELFDKLSWFALYRKGKDKFIIEGDGKSLIKNMNMRGYADSEYGLTFDYDYDNKCFDNMGFVQDLSEEMAYLYYPDRTMYSWYNEKNIYKDDDTAFSFYRNKLDVSSSDNIYEFICKEVEFLNQDIRKENSLFEKIISIPNLKCKIGLKVMTGGYGINIHNRTTKYSNKQKFILNMIALKISGMSSTRLDSPEKEYEEEKDKLIDIYIRVTKNSTDEMTNELKELIKLAESLDDDYFNSKKNYRNDGFYNYSQSDGWFSIDIGDKFDKNIYEFLKKINSKPYLSSNFNIKFDNLSVGEMEFINLFSNLYEGIKKAINNNNKNMILLLDEPGKGFHPEWSRRFINYLCNFSNYLGNKYNCKFQYIITTHSPFMISDMPKNNVKKFFKTDKNGLCKIETSTKGLMSNIHDIMKDDFYLKSPIGCFAENVFTRLQEEISNITDIEEDKDKIKKIKYIIDDIDEIILSSKLHELLQERINEMIYENPKLRNYRIKQLEKELEELRKSEGDDI